MPRAGVGWPELYKGTPQDHVAKPRQTRKRTQELYLGRRAILIGEFNIAMSQRDKEKLLAWINEFMRDPSPGCN